MRVPLRCLRLQNNYRFVQAFQVLVPLGMRYLWKCPELRAWSFASAGFYKYVGYKRRTGASPVISLMLSDPTSPDSPLLRKCSEKNPSKHFRVKGIGARRRTATKTL